ncbi:MAG: xanthine dehydrogenase family protein, partial [Chloroflexi bacterium]
MSAVGTPTRRLEGRDKVVGTTRYTADLDVAGLLHVQLVLSHLASARIRSIETSAARSVPGVVDVVVAGDLPDQDVGGPDQPLATERVFYAGQPVAAVIATSEAAAHDGAAAVEVDLEETEAVADAETAMQDGSPVVLDVQEEADEGDASMHGAAAANESEPVERPRNVSAVASTKRGDASAAMAGSDVTVKATYSVAAVHHTAMEPHVSTVRPEPGGGLTVWSPTQGPFALRDELAVKLDIPAHKIRVVPMPVGGGFGGKVSLLEGLLALLAIRANRPLRLVLTRRQVFAFAKGAPAARFEIEIGAKKDGTLTALRAKFSYDNGASAGWHGGISSAFLAGTYRWPAVDITGYEVSTNKTPVDAYRAPGAPQTYFALESAMDELAQKLDIDPIELRLHNAVSEGDIDGQGAKWPRVAFIECLEEAKAHPLYTTPLGAGEAVGIAAGSWGGA